MRLEHKKFKLAHAIHRLARFFTVYKIASTIPWKVGDTVIDDLTSTLCKVVGIEWADGKTVGSDGRHYNHYGCLGIWIDSPWVDGGRHPWEISEPILEKDFKTWEESLALHRKKSQERIKQRCSLNQKL
jgi:hypothetical protein